MFRREELDQMVAPIALYPDELLAQVLMASTYPGDVADAVAWSKANPNAKGDDAVRQAGSQPWDPSVQALVAFPQALTVLGQDPGWVQRLGDAFLAQPGDVMDAVQRLRQKAQTAGNLQTNEYQRVSMEAAPPAPAPAVGGVIEQAPAQTIIIEAADPEVVYVPSYNPTEVYGSWDYPAYPPPYYPPSPVLVSGLGADDRAGLGHRHRDRRFAVGRHGLGRRRHRHRRRPLQQHQHQPPDQPRRQQLAAQRHQPRRRALSRQRQPRAPWPATGRQRAARQFPRRRPRPGTVARSGAQPDAVPWHRAGTRQPAGPRPGAARIARHARQRRQPGT
ncbi:DUF3300 domain-containing protein [Agrilutibacter solisilvae]|uniref:DUF3300 domain-containing protein n=1 Tax=Agrilutibacter solisilvae TaxID=2763317 RepID=A0A974Y5Z9_9GAMM|nr:DUF3300 domain-containing protein [Lysobacter solisilvae]QSX79186.1 DUF3300 domain-containing protein [Lysobacter solisilvae]